MSLSPIQMYQQQQNPLAQILAGGNDVVTGIFDRAIQIGRDMSNKQLQQEQDMMAMRATETAMAQRRAENLQQNNEDAIKFARGAFESDRKFGVDLAQQGFENQRVTAQDLFSNQQSAQRTDIAERGVAVSEGNLDIRQQELTAEQEANRQKAEAAKAEREQVRSLLGGTAGGTTGGSKPFIKGDAMNNYGTAKTSVDVETEIGNLETAIRSGKLSPVEEANARGRLLKLRPAGGSGSPYAAEDQAMQRKTFENSQAAAADKAMEEKVLGNTTAFIPQEAVLQKRAADAEKYKDPSKKPTGAEVVEAEAYDKDRYASEKASARRMTLPEYLAKGPQDEASKKAREELWNFVNTGGTNSTPTTSAAPSGGSYVTQKAGGL